MENLILLAFDILLGIGYLFIILVTALLIQGISYRIFNFNLYKFLKYILVERELN